MSDPSTSPPPPTKASPPPAPPATKQRKWGTDTYSKFDNLDDGFMPAETPTSFSLSEPPPPQTAPGPSLLSTSLKFRLEKLRSSSDLSNQVWSVDVLPLRLFSSSPSGPVRPLITLLCCLYPTGQLLHYAIESGADPSQPPALSKILDLITAQILDPSDGPQTLPNRVVFTDAEVYYGLKASLDEAAVEGSYIDSLADGIKAYVSKISDKLKLQGVADRNDALEAVPSLRDRTAPAVAAAFYGAYEETWSTKPWGSLKARQAFKLSCGPSTYGQKTLPGPTFWACCIGGDGLFGVACFESRLDLEARMLGSAHGDVWRREARCVYTGEGGKRMKDGKYHRLTGEEVVFKDREVRRNCHGFRPSPLSQAFTARPNVIIAALLRAGAAEGVEGPQGLPQAVLGHGRTGNEGMVGGQGGQHPLPRRHRGALRRARLPGGHEAGAVPGDERGEGGGGAGDGGAGRRHHV